MATQIDERKPGQFAVERFRERRRTWLKRVWWGLPIGAAFVTGIVALLGRLFDPEHMEFFWGLGAGAGVAMVICLADTPPHHIERWRTGAEGERSTAKQLRPLLKAGWVLVNDVESRYGNIDHVVVGPPGVFTIDSKNPGGVCSVKNGVLSVTYREAPDDGYESPGLAKRSRAAAAALSMELRTHGQRRHWVQPVVALWAPFDQTSIEADGVAWVRGGELAQVLRKRPGKLSPAEITTTVEVLRRALRGRFGTEVPAGHPAAAAGSNAGGRARG